MKVLVTGATGFIGSHFVKKSLENGWSTHAVVREGSNHSILQHGRLSPSTHLYNGTLESLIDIVNTTKPNVVVHVASCFIAEHKPQDVDRLVSSNLLFGTQLLEAMSLGGIRNFLNVGTSWQHFEDRDYSPVCLYAATKEAFEKLLQYYVEVRSINAVTLKLYDTYGPGDERKKLFFLFKSLMSPLAKPLQMSPGEQLLNLVHIDDVISAFEQALALLERGEAPKNNCFTVAASESITLKDLVALVEQITHKKLPIEWGRRPYRGREVMRPYSRIRPVPGWSPKVSLQTGITKLFVEEH